MPQLSLYLDEDTMRNVREAAERSGTTLSKYVSNALQEREEGGCRWPQGFFDLYGVCPDVDIVLPEDASFDLEPIAPLDLE